MNNIRINSDPTNVEKTIRIMQAAYPYAMEQTKEFSKGIKGNYALSVWQKSRREFKYKNDPMGTELIRLPAQSMVDAKQGIDCEDFAMIVAASLSHKGLSPFYKVIDQDGFGYNHIYVVLLDRKGNLQFAIDPTVDRFNKEPDYVKAAVFPVSAKGLASDQGERSFLDSMVANSCGTNVQVNIFNESPRKAGLSGMYREDTTQVIDQFINSENEKLHKLLSKAIVVDKLREDESFFQTIFDQRNENVFRTNGMALVHFNSKPSQNGAYSDSKGFSHVPLVQIESNSYITEPLLKPKGDKFDFKSFESYIKTTKSTDDFNHLSIQISKSLIGQYSHQLLLKMLAVFKGVKAENIKFAITADGINGLSNFPNARILIFVADTDHGKMHYVIMPFVQKSYQNQIQSTTNLADIDSLAVFKKGEIKAPLFSFINGFDNDKTDSRIREAEARARRIRIMKLKLLAA